MVLFELLSSKVTMIILHCINVLCRDEQTLEQVETAVTFSSSATSHKDWNLWKFDAPIAKARCMTCVETQLVPLDIWRVSWCYTREQRGRLPALVNSLRNRLLCWVIASQCRLSWLLSYALQGWKAASIISIQTRSRVRFGQSLRTKSVGYVRPNNLQVIQAAWKDLC